jgi:hypothetical protein
MPKWTVVVAVVGEDGNTKGSIEHEAERADQATAIEAVLGRQLPTGVDPTDQLLIYAEPSEGGGQPAPEIIWDIPGPKRDPKDPYGNEARGKAQAAEKEPK